MSESHGLIYKGTLATLHSNKSIFYFCHLCFVNVQILIFIGFPLKSENCDSAHSKNGDAVSWLSHPGRLFFMALNDKIPQPSAELKEKVVTNDGSTLKTEKNTEELGEGTGNNIVVDRNMTSELNGPTTNDETCMKKTTEAEESRSYELKCLNIIQNLAVKFTTEDVGLGNIIEKILNLSNTEDSEIRQLRYRSTETLLDNLLTSNMQELKSIEQIIKAMVLPDSLKKFVVDNNSIMYLFGGYLGQGSFSVVLQGILSKDGENKRVALKRPLVKKFESIIMNEATILSECDHKNIIKILAFRRTGPEIAIEFMELGDLQETILTRQLPAKNIPKILKDIASAMEYLHGKKYLHRRLECENVFINAKKQCKIGGFGSSVYVGNSNGEYEDKDMAERGYIVSPETYSFKIFRYQTDVWAMGILISEIYHLFSGLILPPFMKFRLFQELREGIVRLEKPDRCPNNLFSFVVNHVMDKNFKNRPDFTAIRNKLESYFASV